MEYGAENMDKKSNVTKDFDKAFENTYRILTGKIDINRAITSTNEIFILYDPYFLNAEELSDIINDIIDYYIETEEYEKCQELKNILNLSKRKINNLIKKITLDDDDEDVTPNTAQNTAHNIKANGLSSIDSLINMFKQYRGELNIANNADILKDVIKIKKDTIQYLSDIELWSLMSEKDKGIFNLDYNIFINWTSKLDDNSKKYYSERLINDLSLIPELNEESYNKGKYIYDYNSLVVSIVGESICISNYSEEKIKKLQKTLKKLGIIDSDIRTLIKDDKAIYTLIYSAKQPPTN